MSEINNNAVLRDLYRKHQIFADLMGRILGGPRKIQLAQARVAELDQLRADAVKRVLDLRVATDEKQAKLEASERNLARRRDQLMEAKSNTEYQNLKDQIAADQAACNVLSDEILEALDRIEELTQQADLAKANLQEGTQQLEKLTAEIAEEKTRCEEEIRHLKPGFFALEKQLSGDFQGHYRRIFTSKQFDSLAAVNGTCCKGCNTKIPLEQISKMAQNLPVVCMSCGRLLFLPENYHVK